MICKIKEDQWYTTDLKIDFNEIKSKIIYCLYYKQYNKIINCVAVEEVDNLIAYGDNKSELIEYRNELIELKGAASVHLYLKKIPNIVNYKCQLNQ